VSDQQQPAGGDWASQLVDQLEDTVKRVTAKTTQPIRSIARGATYAFLLLGLGVAAFLLLTIGAIRGLTNALGRAWLADLVIGGIFFAIGLLAWRKRRSR
jgi:Putative Actinobacterial Holin-X, holin superfamily III